MTFPRGVPTLFSWIEQTATLFNMTPEHTDRLFSYGTLQTEPVQLSLFGRRLDGQPDALVGYCLVTIQVQDQSFVAHSGAMQRNLLHTGNVSDVVEGSVLMLTKVELERADAYEPAEYRRVKVQLRSGSDAWVYLS
jgi:gamma-glutamylcyclotransferase (GGCT)/AIG2-like uncharacterized protein YtfP